LHIGILGGGNQAWPSLNKTYASYLMALDTDHTISELGITDPVPNGVDLLVNFSGNRGWELLGINDRPPIAFVLHGGAVLNHSFIRDHISSFCPGDCFIGNCSSDWSIIQNLCVGDAPPAHVLRLPVQADCRDEKAGEFVRHQLGISEDEIVLLIVARLVPQKNVHHALDVVAEAMALNTTLRIKVIIVGNFWSEYPILKTKGQKYHKILQDIVQKKKLGKNLILFPGSLSEKDLRDAYLAGDLAISLSHSIDENFGYFALEAMGYGIPVIGTAYGGQKCSIKRGISGWPVPTWLTDNGIRSSYVGLGKMISTMNRPQLKERGARANDFVKCKFSFLSFKNELNNIISQSTHEYDLKYFKKYVVKSSNSKNCDQSINCSFEFDDLEMYRIPISIYVNDNIPDINIDDSIILSGEICKISNTYLSLDPCWPFSVQLDPSEDELMQKILNNGSAIVDVDNFDICVRFISMGIALPEGEL
jgi:glycosyltransferase involved in cell wall biosynthesis